MDVNDLTIVLSKLWRNFRCRHPPVPEPGIFALSAAGLASCGLRLGVVFVPQRVRQKLALCHFRVKTHA